MLKVGERYTIPCSAGHEEGKKMECHLIEFQFVLAIQKWVFLHWILNFAELNLRLAKIFCLAVLLE